MPAFRFRLDRVHSVKRLVENRAEHAWADAHRCRLHEAATLAALCDTKRSVQEHGYSQADIHLRTAMYAYLDGLESKINHQQQRLNDALELERQRREAWLSARQEREVLDKLREKKQAAFTAEQNRQEQNRLDDLRVQVLGKK